MRRRVYLFVTVALMAALIPVGTASAVDIRIYTDNNPVYFDVSPRIADGRVIAPFRGIFESLGAYVAWDGRTHTVYATNGSREVELTIGSRTAAVNGQPAYLDVPARIEGGRTLVPVRFVGEALGASVRWDGGTNTVHIASRTDRDQLIYRVRKGDTLANLAAQFGTTVKAIMAANGLTSTTIYVDQTLYIPAFATDGSNPQAPPYSHVLMNPDFYFPFPLGADYQPYTNGFGDLRTWSPDGPVQRRHEGIDILAGKGTPLVAVADGVIDKIGWNQYGGWRILYRVEGTDYYFYYAHLSKYAPGLGVGTKVRRGQLLGYVGNTGYGPVGSTFAAPPHLHFGIYRDYKAENPYNFLKYWENHKARLN